MRNSRFRVAGRRVAVFLALFASMAASAADGERGGIGQLQRYLEDGLAQVQRVACGIGSEPGRAAGWELERFFINVSPKISGTYGWAELSISPDIEFAWRRSRSPSAH